MYLCYDKKKKMKAEDIFNITYHAHKEGKEVKISYLWFIFPTSVTVSASNVTADINKDYVLAGEKKKIPLCKIKGVTIL